MKKHLRLLSFLTAVAGVVTLNSCDEDEPTPIPTVTAPTATTAVQVSTAVDVTFSYTAAGGFASSAVTGSGGTAAIKTDGVAGELEGQIVVTYTADASEGAGSLVLTVTDGKGQTATATAVMNKTAVPPPVTIELTGAMTANMTLAKGTSYLIKNAFIVPSGLTLTVSAGAVVKGDKATKGVLVVKQGGTLSAIGTAADPIVFTSAQPVGARDRGDWGGIIIMGDAYVNQSAKPSLEGLNPPANDADYYKYGTPSQSDATVGNNTQNSGTLKYVRIEYAGIELLPNSETNALTLAAVGSGTTVDYVQVSYGGDDGFEWFGGSCNATHLVSLATWDDDFDTDFGWRGNVQWGLVVRAPFVADQSGSTAFESDSQANANAIGTVCDNTTRTGCTQGVFSNITVLGPRDFNSGTGSSSNATRAISANYTRGLHIRRRSAISIFNSFVAGWGAATVPGLTMDDQGTLDNYTAGTGVLANNILLFPDATANAEYGSNVAGAAGTTVKGFWEPANVISKPTGAAAWAPVAGTPAGSINPYTAYGITTANTTGLFYGAQTSANYPSNPNFSIASGGLTGFVAADLFANAKLGSFFDKTLTYKGAFGATDWTDSWAEFQPLNELY